MILTIYLQAKAAFNVYGSVNKKGEATLYHTNRSAANPENPKEQVTTFAVIPPYLEADLMIQTMRPVRALVGWPELWQSNVVKEACLS